jgi:hypothetical protein
MMNLIKNLDHLAYPIHLNYKGSSSAKSSLGGIMTLGIIAFAIYCIIYFGKDIVEKTKPISSFSRNYFNKSVIFLKDFPVMMHYVDETNVEIQLEKYLEYEIIYYQMEFDEKTQKQNLRMDYLFAEKCDKEKHLFGAFKSLFRILAVNYHYLNHIA